MYQYLFNTVLMIYQYSIFISVPAYKCIEKRERSDRKMVTKILDWDDFIKLCDGLYDKLMLKNFDGIISIGRGGTIIGAIIASKLGTRLHPVFVVHKGKGKVKETNIVQLGVTSELKGGRHLLVDDQCFTGETFDLVKEALPNLHLKTASIICRKKQYRPDYYTLSTNEEIMFPYELP
jgi:hypoxanthine phosphoribosyltransferase